MNFSRCNAGESSVTMDHSSIRLINGMSKQKITRILFPFVLFSWGGGGGGGGSNN